MTWMKTNICLSLHHVSRSTSTKSFQRKRCQLNREKKILTIACKTQKKRLLIIDGKQTMIYKILRKK